MNEAVEVVIELSKKQKFAKFAVGAVVGYIASEIAEKGFDVALTAIRKRKATVK